jgi:hypothetical protein
MRGKKQWEKARRDHKEPYVLARPKIKIINNVKKKKNELKDKIKK